MKKKILLGMLFVGVGAGRAEAANLAVITSPPTFLNVLILVFAVACLARAVEQKLATVCSWFCRPGTVRNCHTRQLF